MPLADDPGDAPPREPLRQRVRERRAQRVKRREQRRADPRGSRPLELLRSGALVAALSFLPALVIGAEHDALNSIRDALPVAATIAIGCGVLTAAVRFTRAGEAGMAVLDGAIDVLLFVADVLGVACS